jgi:hypothetical protein
MQRVTSSRMTRPRCSVKLNWTPDPHGYGGVAAHAARQGLRGDGVLLPVPAESGLASIKLRVSDRTARRSAVDARWFEVDNVQPHRVGAGDL